MAKNLSQFSIHICGSLLYTIRPIHEAINLFNENQFARVEADLTKQRVAKKLAKFGHVSPRELLCEVLPEKASPSPIEDDTGEIEPLPENLRGTKKEADRLCICQGIFIQATPAGMHGV